MAASMTFNMRPPLKTVIKSLGLTAQEMKKIDDQTLDQFTAWGVREIQKSMTSSGQGQPGGEAWFPLSEDWIDWKDAIGWSNLIGVATGAMKQSTSGFANKSKKQSEIGVGGAASEYAEYFAYTKSGQDKRPVLPEDDYAVNKLQNLYFTKLGR